MALPAVLERLESYACYEIGSKTISATGTIRLLNRDAYVGKMVANTEVTFFETLEGLEARLNGQRMAVLRDYLTFRQIVTRCQRRELPSAFYFEPCMPVICPRIAVAA
jgi:hypothetical protein